MGDDSTLRRGGEGKETTKGLVKAQVPYNCFYKCCPPAPAPPAAHPAALAGASFTEHPHSCMLICTAKQPPLSLLATMDEQTDEMIRQPQELKEPEREPTPWASDSDWEE